MAVQDTPLTESFFYILLALRQPRHGYGIIQDVEQLTEGRVVLGAGTLYGALKTMQTKGWIRIVSEQQDSRKKKEYALTCEGIQAFRTECGRMREALEAADKFGKNMAAYSSEIPAETIFGNA